MSVWIEKYKDGKMVNNNLGKLSFKPEESGSIIFTSQKEHDAEKKRTFNIGISSNGSTGSTIASDNGLDKKSNIWSSFQVDKKSLDEGEVVLAGLVYSKGKNGTISIPANFYEDASEMKKYDVVYLFKAKFKE